MPGCGSGAVVSSWSLLASRQIHAELARIVHSTPLFRFPEPPLLALAGLALSSFVSGCATIVEGTDQTVTVTSDPSGAACELKRYGEVIAVVNPTPGSASIDKSKKDISVLCVREGYADGGGAMASEFQGMTFGNLLFGGIIGVAVDAGSGAMHEYNPTVQEGVIMASSEYVPLPPGTPSPYEGVRMSSFSANDMRWFCGQPWRQRVAPTGRTEYNPCHISQVFAQ